MLLIIIQLSVLGALVFSLAGYLGRWHKYTELASHFKMQYLLASVICLLVCLFYREWTWAAVAAFGVTINLAAIAPWYINGNHLGGKRIGGRRVKLLLANVNFNNSAHDTFIAFVQRHAPHVLVVQEVDSVWCNSLQPLQSLYPFFEALPKDGGSGMAIYSRFQFERLNLILAEGDARPSILAKMNIDGVSVSLLSLHPRAPIQRGHFELRNEMLASAADCLQNLSGPKICIGDLNITQWSPYYRRFVKQTRLANVRKGFGLLPSWPTFLFFKCLMIPLDHCLVSDGICVIDVKTGEPIGRIIYRCLLSLRFNLRSIHKRNF